MCLILFAYNAHPRYLFILAANRDEFYSRPTEPAAFWTGAPEVLGGRDSAAGGTWLGVTKTGRFAAVTNYRDPLAPAGVKSRGSLTGEFLIGVETAQNYLQKLEREKNDYSGFNLLVGDFGGDEEESQLYYFSNRGKNAVKLAAGIYGLSNRLLDTDWHKVERSKAKFSIGLQNSGEIAAEDLFPILADRAVAPDDKLPDTGIGQMRERMLSPVFIETEDYGTRSSAVLTIERGGRRVNFTEKTFVGTIGETIHEFDIK